jgi:hypothetical protein
MKDHRFDVSLFEDIHVHKKLSDIAVMTQEFLVAEHMLKMFVRLNFRFD